MSGIYKDTDIKLFCDMTSPLQAIRAYADESGEGGEDLEGGSPEESVVFHRPEGLKTEALEAGPNRETVSRPRARRREVAGDPRDRARVGGR